MKRKDEIMKLIKEGKISVKEGLNMIAGLKENILDESNYFSVIWKQKRIQNQIAALKDNGILVLTDYEEDLFVPLRKENRVFYFRDWKKQDSMRMVQECMKNEKIDTVLFFFDSARLNQQNNMESFALCMLNLYHTASAHKTTSLEVFCFYETAEVTAVNEAAAALFRSLYQENSEFNYHVIELANKEMLMECLENEYREKEDIQVKYDSQKTRFVKDIIVTKRMNQENPFRNDATYVFSGGTGGIGKILLRKLVKQYHGNYILLGRSAESEDIKTFIGELSAYGSTIQYYTCNIAEQNEVSRVAADIENRYGEVNGIIHLAAVLHDGISILKKQEDFLEVIRTKISGAENLYQEFRSNQLEFITFCSSISALTGSIGQCDYSFANSYLELFALQINQVEGRNIANAVGFPLWANGGMKPVQNLTGSKGITNEEGIELFLSAYGFENKVIYYVDQNTLNLIQKAPVRDEIRETKHELHDSERYYEEQQLSELTQQYLVGIISEEMNISTSKLTTEQDLNELGLDSIMVMEITKNIEKSLGTISKTLFFEHTQIKSIGAVLLEKKRDKLELLFEDKLRKNTKKVTAKTIPVQQKQKEKTVTPKITPILQTKKEKKAACQDIAIIGMAGRFPMSNDMEELWDNISTGKDCIVEIPKERWDYRKYFDTDKNERGKSYSKWGGFIDNYDKFDPLFFKISPREADFLDPQERVFLETAWETVEDAGYTRDELSKVKVSVFVGVMYNHYQLFNVEEGLRGEVPVQNGSYASIANRVSYILNLHGASIAIDTMCSSSLTSIHLACQSIRDGESDMALAGGVNISSHPLKYIMLSQQKFLSTDGRCRSFGEGGDGYVPGEGSGSILLKSLEQAEKDGDRIYAVIKGSTINHGGKTRGITVPSPAAQTSMMRNTFDTYDIDPRSINYIETHGTGTSLGDPIEITGLENSFDILKETKQRCAIGSIKSNIGHTESASGVAAIAKVVLQMKHKQLVPSIHSDKLNPNIDFSSIPFYVQRKLEEWKPVQLLENGMEKRYPRRAGITGLGAGGSNAFVVLEEYEDKREYDDGTNEVLFVLSAKTQESLKAYASKMYQFITEDGEGSKYSRKALTELLEEKLTEVVAGTMQIPVEQLDSDVSLDSLGIDYVYLNRIVNEVFDLFGIVQPNTTYGITSIKELSDTLVENYEEEIHSYFEPQFQKKEEKELPSLFEMAYMLQTGREQYEQRLAVITSSYEELSEKLFKYLEYKEEKGVCVSRQDTRNDAMSSVFNGEEGQRFIKSLFENQELDKIALIWCSGQDINWKNCYGNVKIRKCSLPTYPFKKELHWIPKLDNQRNSGIRDYPMLDDYVFDIDSRGITFKKRLESRNIIVSEHLVKKQKVLPGVAYIEMIYEAMDKAGKANLYDVSSIYWLVPVYVTDEYVDIYANISETDKVKEFVIYTLQNEDKVVHCKGTLVDSDAGEEQLEWDSRYDYQEIPGEKLYELFEEAGITYQSIYRGLNNVRTGSDRVQATVEIDEYMEDYYLFPGVADSALQSIAVMNKADGKVFVPYCIGRVCFYRRLKGTARVYTVKTENGTINTTITDEKDRICLIFKNIVLRELSTEKQNFLYYPVWEVTPGLKERTIQSSKAAVVYSKESSKLASKLEEKLKNMTVIPVELSQDEDGQDKMKEVIEANEDINEVFFLSGMNEEIVAPDDETEFMDSQKRSVTSLFRLVKQLLNNSYRNQELSLYVITNNTIVVKDYTKVNPYASVLHGFTLSFEKEISNWFIRCIDIDMFYSNVEDAAIQILSERKQDTNALVVYRENERFARNIYPIQLPDGKESAFVENGVYMIFGGSGGIGGVLADYLSKQYQAKVVLIGRSSLNASIEEKVDRINRNGGEGIYIQADLGKLDTIKNAITITKEKFGRINGVIHSALVLRDKSVMFMTEEMLDSSLESKVTGSMLLNKALLNEKLDFLLYFSSANALISPPGQSNYSAGCTFEDAYAEYQNKQNSYVVKHINWGYWGTVGVVASDEYKQNFSQKGVLSIEPAEGMQAIEKILKNDISALIPFKVEERVLNSWGIFLDKVLKIEETTEITTVHIPESVFSQEQHQQMKDRIALLSQFNRFGVILLLKKFQQMGYFKNPSEKIAMKQMKEELGIVSTYDRMFLALLSMLERNQFIQIKEDMVITLPIVGEKETVEAMLELEKNMDDLIVQFPEIKAYVHLMKVCVEAYAEVLSGKENYKNVMFPNGSQELVENIYAGNVIADFFNGKMTELTAGYVKDVLAVNPDAKVRILEIGAGKGETSAFILEGLKSLEEHITYTYTDRTESFVESGRKQFAGKYPFVEFRVLDVEEVSEQSRKDLGVYDIVVAANGLHAAKRMDYTLSQIKNLMKKDAWLIVNEITEIEDYTTLTFGLTDGWWTYEEEENRLPCSPLLDSEQWERAMRLNGFLHFVTYGIDGIQDRHSKQSLLIAQSDGMTLINKKDELQLEIQLSDRPKVTVKTEDAAVKIKPFEGDSLEQIQKELVSIMAKVLSMEDTNIDIHTDVSDYGIDSLVTMDFNRELEKYYGEIPTTFVFDNPTIAKMAVYLKDYVPVENKVKKKEKQKKISIKFINQYQNGYEEDFYMFWERLDKKINFNEYIENLKEIDHLSSLDTEKLQHIMVCDGDDFGIETVITGEGKPIVFIPGYGTTASQWMKQIEYFKDHYKIIILDVPGCGLSVVKEDTPLSLENIADIFMRVLTILGVKEEVTVAGASFGSMVAQQMAYRHKDAIQSLISLGGFAKVSEKIRTGTLKEFIEEDIKDLDEEDKYRIRINNFINPSFSKFYDYLEDGNEFDTEYALEGITAKVLLLQGDKDAVIDADTAEEIASKLKSAEIHIVHNAGHMLNWTNSNEVNTVIWDFLRQ